MQFSRIRLSDHLHLKACEFADSWAWIGMGKSRGITEYLPQGREPKMAQMGSHESARTTELYVRRNDHVKRVLIYSCRGGNTGVKNDEQHPRYLLKKACGVRRYVAKEWCGRWLLNYVRAR